MVGYIFLLGCVFFCFCLVLLLLLLFLVDLGCVLGVLLIVVLGCVGWKWVINEGVLLLWILIVGGDVVGGEVIFVSGDFCILGGEVGVGIVLGEL